MVLTATNAEHNKHIFEMADVQPTAKSSVAATRDVKRRARLVCLRCHEKKIKCDLQSRGANASKCGHCRTSGAECHIRASRRKGAQKQKSISVASISSAPGSALPLSPTSQGGLTQSSRSPRTSLDLSIISYRQEDAMLALCDAASAIPDTPSSAAPVQTNSAQYHSEPVEQDERAYIGQSGFMQIFSQSRAQERRKSNTLIGSNINLSTFAVPLALKESFVETYLDYCYTWCPLLSKRDFFENAPFSNSVLLQQSLGLLGSVIKPPLIKHASSATFYDRAKMLFYGNHEHNPLIRIISVMLLYWWSAGPPNVASMDSQFWWTSVAIRLAQEIDLHREPAKGHVFRPGETLGLRRRIWWTLYARERLTSICQGRPCIIHPDDCDVRPLSLDDFPEGEAARAEIFIHWVRICDIMGRVAKQLTRRTEATPFPVELATELIAWVHHLPDHLRLPFGPSQTLSYNREVHILHLPYLTAITLLHMSCSAQPIPRAYTAAVLAASCTARIFEDLLARGSLAFMNGMSGWYVTIALLAMLHARQIECLRDGASEHIEILFVALREMAKTWHSSRMFLIGFEKLLGNTQSMTKAEADTSFAMPNLPSTSTLTDLVGNDSENYLEYFPGATTETSPLFRILLTESPPAVWPDAVWPPNDLPIQLQGLFDQPFDGLSYEAFNF